MTEHGYWSPSSGEYWQVTGAPGDEHTAKWPADFVEIPLKPGSHFDFDGAAWVPGPVTRDRVKLERARRIEAGLPVAVTGRRASVVLQGRPSDRELLANLKDIAQMRIAAGDKKSITNFRDANNITHALMPSQVVELWLKGSEYVGAVMEASFALIEAAPIPQDFADDRHWPTR